MKFSTVLENKQNILTKWKVALMSSLLVFLFSCDFNNKEIVCEVGDQELTEEKLEQLILLNNGSPGDPKDREQAINHWVHRELINKEMAETMTEELEKNIIQSEIEFAERNLFALENQYIRENMDSVVSDEEIQAYYENNRENYVKESYIVRALYMKVADTLGDHDELKDIFLLKNDKDKEEIKKYANLYATNFYYEDKKWIYFEDLIRDIPIAESKKKELVTKRGEAVFKEEGFAHFVNILDYRLKNISSPMEFEKKLIQKHILKRRVNKLREEARETILENVKQKYKVTYH